MSADGALEADGAQGPGKDRKNKEKLEKLMGGFLCIFSAKVLIKPCPHPSVNKALIKTVTKKGAGMSQGSQGSGPYKALKGPYKSL